MNTYDLNEVANIINQQGYKYVCLTDQFGKELIPFNSRNSVGERMDEIKLRIASPAIKDGVYIIKAKNAVSKAAVVDDFPIIKGNPETLSERKEIVLPQATSPDILTYEQALKMQVRIKELELENENLKKEIRELTEENTELQAELETSMTLSEDQPEQKTMVETAKDFLSELMTFGAPLLDKHFALKERQLEIEAAKYLQAKKPQQQPNENNEMLKVREWILTKKENPEQYNALAAMFQNSAGQVAKFVELVANYDGNLLQELTEL